MAGKSYTVTKIGDELANAVQLRAALAGDDPKLVLDMIEGSTDLHEAICVVDGEILEDESILTGLKVTIEALGARKSRLEKSIETRRSIILSAMDRVDIQSIKGPLGTLSRRPTPPQVVVTDESKIPADYFTNPEPKVDKTALKLALQKGPVEGAELSNGGVTLSIRRA